MGGRGSGRRGTLGLIADKCEEYHSIDLAWLRRQGYFRVGVAGSLRWSRGEHQTGSIGYRVEAGGLRLLYRVRRHDDEWQDINELIAFAETPGRYGGRRQWFLCPSCGRRCRIIYGGHWFRCRQCHRLRYESQYEPGYARAASRSHKLRARLGHHGPLDDTFPPRPKGMHWRTYRRLAAEDERLGEIWTCGALASLRLVEGAD